MGDVVRLDRRRAKRIEDRAKAKRYALSDLADDHAALDAAWSPDNPHICDKVRYLRQKHWPSMHGRPSMQDVATLVTAHAMRRNPEIVGPTGIRAAKWADVVGFVANCEMCQRTLDPTVNVKAMGCRTRKSFRIEQAQREIHARKMAELEQTLLHGGPLPDGVEPVTDEDLRALRSIQETVSRETRERFPCSGDTSAAAVDEVNTTE